MQLLVPDRDRGRPSGSPPATSHELPSATAAARVDPWLRAPDDRKLVELGTHRCRAIDDTLARVGAVTAALGVTRISNLTGLDTLGIPVFSAVSPGLNARWHPGFVTVSSGKGITAAHARVSALMELAERWSGRRRLDDAVVVGSHRRLRRVHDVVDPAAFPSLGYGDDDVLDWVRAVELPTGREVLVPSGAVFVIDLPSDGSMHRHRGHSHGLASGNTLPEALLHGCYELVERDAEHRCHGPGPMLDLEHLHDAPEVADMVLRLRHADCRVVVRQLASPTAIPTFLAAAFDPGVAGCRAICGGMGTHLDPRVAAARAVSELVQSRAVAYAGSREDLARLESDLRQVDPHAALADDRAWWAHDDVPLRLSSMADASTDTISGDLAIVLERLGAAGCPVVYAVDLTRPETAIPVVRAIVPGLGWQVRT